MDIGNARCDWGDSNVVYSARMAVAETSQQAVESGIGGNLFRNIIGRFFLGVSKAQPSWYYRVNLPVDLLPWGLFLPWSVSWVWRHRRDGKACAFC